MRNIGEPDMNAQDGTLLNVTGLRFPVEHTFCGAQLSSVALSPGRPSGSVLRNENTGTYRRRKVQNSSWTAVSLS